MHSLSSLLPVFLAASTVHGMRNIQARATGAADPAVVQAQAEMSQASAQAASAASAWSAAHPTTSVTGQVKRRRDQGEVAAAQSEMSQASAQAASAASDWYAHNPTTTMLQRRQDAPAAGDPAAIAEADAAQASASSQAAQAAAKYTSDQIASVQAASFEAQYSSLAPDGVSTVEQTCPASDPLNTCNQFIEMSTSGAQAYNASCLNDGSGGNLNVDSCQDVITILCQNQWGNPGEWVWATGDGCTLGSWLPPAPANPDGTSPPPGTYPYQPDQNTCEVLIYGGMLSSCAGSGSNDYNVISVNLPVLPNNQQSGQQVDARYGSYLIAHNAVRDVPDKAGEQANLIPVSSIIQAASVQFVAAVASESAQLATMTDDAAKAAQSDLKDYAEAVLAPKSSGT